MTFERPGDSAVLPCLINGALSVGVRISKVVADGAYDSVSNWELLTEKEIVFQPNLKPTFTNDRDIPARQAQRLLEEQLGKTLNHWLSGYSYRWLVEAFFSVFKRLYGQKVPDRTFSAMAVTLRIRFTMYNLRRCAILKRISEKAEELRVESMMAELDECLAGSEA